MVVVAVVVVVVLLLFCVPFHLINFLWISIPPSVPHLPFFQFLTLSGDFESDLQTGKNLLNRYRH